MIKIHIFNSLAIEIVNSVTMENVHNNNKTILFIVFLKLINMYLGFQININKYTRLLICVKRNKSISLLHNAFPIFTDREKHALCTSVLSAQHYGAKLKHVLGDCFHLADILQYIASHRMSQTGV